MERKLHELVTSQMQALGIQSLDQLHFHSRQQVLANIKSELVSSFQHSQLEPKRAPKARRPPRMSAPAKRQSKQLGSMLQRNQVWEQRKNSKIQ